MRTLRKVIAGTCASLLMAATLCTAAQAAEMSPQPEETVQAVNSGIQPYADVIVNKYRMYNGKLQKRRWNETRGYWVDPYWITIGTVS
ncbi:hypothetical protein [Acutalibacter muris]|uniref:hypothetical protein n=1 Tax=Acutalibacter muris TaxID=1796620 RepID=UPI00272E02DE|nr:hypothetical protein [Acutalibacter muris]